MCACVVSYLAPVVRELWAVWQLQQQSTSSTWWHRRRPLGDHVPHTHSWYCYSCTSATWPLDRYISWRSRSAVIIASPASAAQLSGAAVQLTVCPPACVQRRPTSQWPMHSRPAAAAAAARLCCSRHTITPDRPQTVVVLQPPHTVPAPTRPLQSHYRLKCFLF